MRRPALLLLVLAGLGGLVLSSAQAVTALLGERGQYAYSEAVATDSNGNKWVTGHARSNLDGETLIGTRDLLLVRFDSAGVKRSTTLVGTANVAAEGRAVAVDNSGGVWVVGYTDGDFDGQTLTGTRDLFLTKFNSDGVRLSTILMGAASAATEANSIAIDGSGNLWVTGDTEGSLDGHALTGTKDVFLIKFNSLGIKQWTLLKGVANKWASGRAVTTDSTGHIWVTGVTTGALDAIEYNTMTGIRDLFLFKFNSAGVKQSTTLVGAVGASTYPTAIATDSDGDAFVTGYTDGDFDGHTLTGPRGLFLIKFDKLVGVKGKSTLLSVTGKEASAHGIVVDSNDYVWVTGWTNGNLDGQSLTGRRDIVLVKFNSLGFRQSTTLVGAYRASISTFAIAVDNSGYLWLTGHVDRNFGGIQLTGAQDIFLFRQPFNVWSRWADGATDSVVGTFQVAATYTPAALIPEGALTLKAGIGIHIQDSIASAAAGKPLVLNADSDSDGSGTLTVSTGKVLSTNDAHVTITAYDLDLDGSITTGSGADRSGKLQLHGAKAGQTLSVGGTEPGSRDFIISDAELSRITVLSGGYTVNRFVDTTGIDTVDGVVVGSPANGDVFINGVTSASTKNIGRVTVMATGPTQKAIFEGTDSTFNKGITVRSKTGIDVTTSVTTENTGSYFNSGTGALTIRTTRVLSTTSQQLTLASDDVQGSYSYGTGTLGAGPGSPDQSHSLGGTDTGGFHLSDPVLSSTVSSTGGYSLGTDESGSVTVDGLTSGTTSNRGIIKLVATKAARTVSFINSPSTFSKGLSVRAMAGINVAAPLTSLQNVAMFAGTGTLTIAPSKQILTYNNAMMITADDLDIKGTINTGTSPVSVDCTTFGHTVGMGTVRGQLTLDGSEMAQITSNGLNIGATHCGTHMIEGVTNTNIATLAGIITVAAKYAGAQAVFQGTTSRFKSLATQAVNGIHVNSDVVASGIITVNADSDSVGASGTFSVSERKTIVSESGDLAITAWDIDLDGAIRVMGGSISIHGSEAGQTIGIGSTAKDMQVEAVELRRMFATGLTFQPPSSVITCTGIWAHDAATVHPFTLPSGCNYVTHAPTPAPTVVTPGAKSTGEAHGVRVPRLNVAQHIGLSADIHVHWTSSSGLDQVINAHSMDWIGLYKAGSCSQNGNMRTTDKDQNSCYLAYELVADTRRTGQSSGTVTFKFADVRWPAGDYEVRYFLGDSQQGNGVVCRDLGTGVGSTYCALEAAASSVTFSVTPDRGVNDYGAFQTKGGVKLVPGFERGY